MRFLYSLLVTALILICSSCSSHPKPKKHGKNPPALHTDFSHLDKKRKKIVDESMTWLGTPYKYAGQERGKGADCSGMVMSVYLDATGIKLPRNSAKQAEFCKRIKEKEVKPGDLVFFATGKDPDRISHVGIMLDDVNFIHSSTSKGVVISRTDTPYYIRTFMMYGRVPSL